MCDGIKTNFTTKNYNVPKNFFGIITKSNVHKNFKYRQLINKKNSPGNTFRTRKHSSRMHSACLLTVSRYLGWSAQHPIPWMQNPPGHVMCDAC